MSLFTKFNGDSEDDAFVLENQSDDEQSVEVNTPNVHTTSEVKEDDKIEIKEDNKVEEEGSDEIKGEEEGSDEIKVEEEKETTEKQSKKRSQSDDALKKKKEKFAEMKRRRKERNEQNRLDFNSETMSPIEQAAYFWSYIVVENTNNQFAEYGIEHAFEDAYLMPMSQPHDDKQLVERIKECIPDWKEQLVSKQKGKKGKNGSPSVLILSISAIRCTEVLKELASFKLFIPKLFGKHMKVQEQKKSLNKVTPIAVGVPNRVFKLAEDGIVDLSNVSTVIIDMKPNEKTMNVLSLKETRDALAKLYMKYLHNGVIHKTIKVGLW